MNRIEAIRIFNVVLKTVRRFQAERGAMKCILPSITGAAHGGQIRTYDYKAWYLGKFAECGKKALRSRVYGAYSSVARECGVSKQYVWQVATGKAKDTDISRALAVHDATFQRIAWNVFQRLYVENREAAAVIRILGLNEHELARYEVRIAVAVAPELLKRRLYTFREINERIDEDLEALGKR